MVLNKYGHSVRQGLNSCVIKVYLVGDPNQLPATVLSARASEYSYSKSLFKRLMNAGYPVHMMNMQYRMHPAISSFPSTEFYGGKLLDAPVNKYSISLIMNFRFVIVSH